MHTLCGFAVLMLLAQVSHSREVVREATDRVLSDPAYRDGIREIVVSEDLASQLRRWIEKALDFVRSIADGLANLSVDQPILFWLIMLALIGALVVILWHLGYSLSLLVRGSPAGSPARAEERARAQRFAELWSEARRLADRGEYSGAIRHLLLALLARAHDSRIRLPAGWTNREIVAYVSRRRALQRLAEPLRAFVGTFDRIWYGQQIARESDYTRCAELVSVCVEGLQAEEDDGGPGSLTEH